MLTESYIYMRMSRVVAGKNWKEKSRKGVSMIVGSCCCVRNDILDSSSCYYDMIICSTSRFILLVFSIKFMHFWHFNF